MTQYRDITEITNTISQEDHIHQLALLSLIMMIEDGKAAPPTIHMGNWYSAFRELLRCTFPLQQGEVFWPVAFRICIHHGCAKILGKHAVPIPVPTQIPTSSFAENIRFYQPHIWRNRFNLRDSRKALWETLSKSRSLVCPYSTFEQRFHSDHELIFSDTQIQTAYAAFHTAPNKRFLILSGLSGTGKTQFLLQFAKSYILSSNLNPQEHLHKVSVSPDWRDPSPLLGYINPLVERSDQLRFVKGEITDFLIRAHRYPLLPFFLILDEMNLARVELYFAPLLSAMETPEEPIRFHGERGIPSGVPAQLDAWPNNLFIAGTVNMDETTHPFSDKVLDRAFTMEFWDIDIQGYLQKNVPARFHKVLHRFYDILLPVHRHFGYRSLKEIMLFLSNAEHMISSEAQRASLERTLLDQAVFAKILPKIRGVYHEKLELALQQAHDLCVEESLFQSAQKLQAMLHQLQSNGVTKFWS